MVQYRRDFTPGATYFFTVTLKNRTSNLLTQYSQLLGQSFRHAKKHYPFITEAIVVLPDHLHTIWQLPLDNHDYSTRWRLIKTHFTQALAQAQIPLVRDTRGEYNVWQHRFWEHRIRDAKDLEQHVNYIHYNPVKHHLTQNPADWSLSSIHSYIRQGLLPKDWGKSIIVGTGRFGEER